MLRRIVECAVDIARKGDAGMRIDVHTLGGPGSARDLDLDVVRELHVSLTRPFFLRASEGGNESRGEGHRQGSSSVSPLVSHRADLCLHC